MSSFWWPFRTGDDDTLNATPAAADVYASIGDMPTNDYYTELQRYHEAKWRRGMVHNVVPGVLFGAASGLGWGTYQSRRSHMRHISRPKVIATHVGAVTAIALTTTAVHHFLLVSSGYKQSSFQPLIAGMVGGCAFSMSYTGSVNMVAGALVGVLYTAICKTTNWYQERAMIDFLTTQQQIQTPIHRVAPELQMLYRSFLFDHRPVEDSDVDRRRALLLEREANDTRLDSQAYLSAVQRAMESVTFPEWWPLRLPTPLDDKQALLDQRLRDDAMKRRIDAINKENSGDVIFSRPLRTEKTRAYVPD